ncbi:hypothetical protein EYF80_011933 [Liparis tanakae]|uniref:Uncharacterized protein n=1 Tax=Liparis tanakae TaxID=230148 RepID=A0A4Z2IIZ3_9TELE|nr:hypothetical protein EYF80_011933 [Liparis tanakae]
MEPSWGRRADQDTKGTRDTRGQEEREVDLEMLLEFVMRNPLVNKAVLGEKDRRDRKETEVSWQLRFPCRALDKVDPRRTLAGRTDLKSASAALQGDRADGHMSARLERPCRRSRLLVVMRLTRR